MNNEVKKRYWLRGGVCGLIFGTLVFFRISLVSYCIGGYMNLDGTSGSNCPNGINNLISNFKNPMHLYLGISLIIALFLIGMLVGWIFGKIKNRFFTA